MNSMKEKKQQHILYLFRRPFISLWL